MLHNLKLSNYIVTGKYQNNVFEGRFMLRIVGVCVVGVKSMQAMVNLWQKIAIVSPVFLS